MEIKKIIHKSRNDFKAIFQCERCGHEFTAWGYSDNHYFVDVIPGAICPSCGENSRGETEQFCKNHYGFSYMI